MTSPIHRFWITLALVGVAGVWGGTFVVVKDAVERYPFYGFLGWRFWVAVIAFLLLFPRVVTRIKLRTVAAGLLAGGFLCAGYIFQTWGLEDTNASKAAFITGMFVVITPIMQAVLLRRLPQGVTAIGALVAVAGLWLLSGDSGGGWNVGDTRTLLCAVAYSAHMIVLGSIGRDHEVLPLTLVQLMTTAVVCSGISLATEPLVLPHDAYVWVAILFTGVFGSAVAFAVQTYAQRYISPARTALILISEPAFGGLFGWLAGETFGIRGLAGAVLILGGMVLAETIVVRTPTDEKVVYTPALEGPSVALPKE